MAPVDQQDEGTVYIPRAGGEAGPGAPPTGEASQRSHPGFPSAPPSAPLSNPSLVAVPPGLAEPVRVGDTLKERFVLQRELGTGGMGKVFLALDLRKQEVGDRKPHVAVKVLREDFREHRDSIVAMHREARKAQELSHPNIVRVYDFDRDGTRFFIVMEYLVGQSLHQLIRNETFKPMSLPEAAPIVAGIGAALAHAHDNGFVHADLKPGNVILTEGGKVKVIDFGLARAIPREMENVDDKTFDAASLEALTPAYASVDMLAKMPLFPRDDVYALACITYELLTGRHPFDRIRADQARNAGLRARPVEGLAEARWRALERGLAFNGADRTQTVGEFLKGLGLGVGTAPRLPEEPRQPTSPPPGPGAGSGRDTLTLPHPPRQPASGGRGKLWAALSLLLVVGLGGAVWSNWQAAAPPSDPGEKSPPGRSGSNGHLEPAPSPSPSPVTVTVPGIEHVKALLGEWCGDAMRLRAEASRWTFLLPNGAEVPLGVASYEKDGDRLRLTGTRPDGRALQADFESQAGDSLTHARVQVDGLDWRELGRVFRRCDG